MHYYKFNIADWNLSTAHLTLEEEAIYFRLINFYYDTESPIPLEIHSVMRRLRLGSDESIVVAILQEFFTKTDKGFVHSRCEEILKDYRKTIKNNRSNGARGGRPRNGADCSETKNKPSGFSKETEQEPTDNPNQEPLTTNHKPETNKKNIPLNFDSWPAQPSEQVWKDWMAMRKSQKAPVSQTVVDRLGKVLSQCVANGFTVDDCLGLGVMRNWRGLELDWVLKNAGQIQGAHPRYQSNQKIGAGTLGFTSEDYARGINEDGSF